MLKVVNSVELDGVDACEIIPAIDDNELDPLDWCLIRDLDLLSLYA